MDEFWKLDLWIWKILIKRWSGHFWADFLSIEYYEKSLWTFSLESYVDHEPDFNLMSLNRYKRVLETSPQANLHQSGREYFLLFFFRRVRATSMTRYRTRKKGQNLNQGLSRWFSQPICNFWRRIQISIFRTGIVYRYRENRYFMRKNQFFAI